MLLPMILAAATGGAPPPHVVTNPDWAAVPSGGDMIQYYPPLARIAGQPGRTVIDCLVRSNGSVTDCTIESETPPGWGFGETALRLSSYFRLKPKTQDGEPVDGAMVRIPLGFQLAENPEAPAPYACYAAFFGSTDPAEAPVISAFRANLKREIARARVDAAEGERFIAKVAAPEPGPQTDLLKSRCRATARRP